MSLSDPGAIIEIVNSTVSVPFTGAQDNDCLLRSTMSNQRMVFAISNVPVMTLSNQNVGINTMTPTSKLHVEGDIYINGSVTTQMPLAFNGIQLSRTLAAPSTSVTVAPNLDSLFRDSNGNVKLVAGSNGYIAFYAGSNTEIARISSNSMFGVGTTTPTSKLTLYGPASASNGPHIATISTADTYPLFQLLSWSHNSIFMTFDGYYDSTAWRASHATSYQIGKSNNNLNISYSTGATPGQITSFSNAITINSQGNVGINTSSPTTSLTVNGDITTNKIISNQFRVVQLFDNTTGPLHAKSSASFTLGGGTLHLRGGLSIFNSTTNNVTSIVTFSIKNTLAQTVAATLIYVPISTINDHRAASVSRTITGIVAGTYTVTITLSGAAGTTSDASDYLNMTLIEYPF